jgi:hypothetical protein
MNKKYRLKEDGTREVAILISRGYGAGWVSWIYNADVLFDENIVDFVLNDKVDSEEFDKYMEDTYPNAYIGGKDGLTVVWLNEGTEFQIEEYDGAESLRLKDGEYWHKA